MPIFLFIIKFKRWLHLYLRGVAFSVSVLHFNTLGGKKKTREEYNFDYRNLWSSVSVKKFAYPQLCL